MGGFDLDELNNLIKQNIHEDEPKTFKEVASILDNNVDVNSLITWIKITSACREIKPEEVLKMAKKLKARHSL